MVIEHTLLISKTTMEHDGALVRQGEIVTPEMLYAELGCNYPRFFKMDKLCKWAWIATEYLFHGNNLAYRDIDPYKTGVILTTSSGCIDADKRYYDTINMPSPSLFVYTLPNIMLGEICIRHGFKGEQLCLLQDEFDVEELSLAINDALTNKGMYAILSGWINVSGDDYDIRLTWSTR